MKASFLVFAGIFTNLVIVIFLLTGGDTISTMTRPSNSSLQTEQTSGASLRITGPTIGDVHISYPFVATVGGDKPPEEFIWQATDYPTIIHETQAITSPDAFTDTMNFSWDTPGEKTISVTARLAPYGKPVSQVYTFSLRTYTISGRVEKVVDTPTSDPDPIEDVWITLSPQVSGVANPVKTSTNGEYTLSNLPAGEYHLTPFKEGYIFSPYVVPVSVPAPSDAKTNFTAYSAIFVDEPQGEPQGVAQNAEPARIREDQYLVIRLNATPSTGYVWVPTRTSQLLHRVEYTKFVAGSVQDKTPAKQILVYRPLGTGTAMLEFAYRRPWKEEEEIDPNEETFSLTVQIVGAFEETLDVVHRARPAAPTGGHGSPPNGNSPLPTSFNWCDDVDKGCTEVRDQGSCGACWAFATNGAFEANILANEGTEAEKDLSEQYLISFNTKKWGCGGGGPAFDHYKDNGAVEEQHCKYKEADNLDNPDDCDTSIRISERVASSGNINSRDYNDDGELGIAIKQKLLEHGPVYFPICPDFHSYKKESSEEDNDPVTCSDDQLKHAILLVGWDDEEQAWRVRNSWGTDWEKSGYAWVKYSSMPPGTYTYMVYYKQDGPEPPTLSPPTNLRADPSKDRIDLSWEHDESGEVNGFRIDRKKGNDEWVPIAQVEGADKRRYTDNNTPCNCDNQVTYSYRVLATNATTESLPSEIITAEPECGPIPPDGLVAKVNEGNGITLTWNDNSSDEDGFMVQRGNGVEWTNACNVGENTTTCQDASSNLTCNTTYEYHVYAYKDCFKSPYSNPVNPTWRCRLAPPTNLIATAVDNTKIELAWEDQSDNEDGFVIMRWSTDLRDWDLISRTVEDAEIYTDEGLECGKPYYYFIYAYKGNEHSGYSNIASAIPYCSPEDEPGDCDGNGDTNIHDIGAVLERIYKDRYLDNNGCDANGDDRVDAGDTTCIPLLISGESCQTMIQGGTP